jgi:hypothetical protein
MITETNPEPGPTWKTLVESVNSEECPTAIALLNVDQHGVVRNDAERWLHHSSFGRLDLESGVWIFNTALDWEGWVADVDERGRAWSSTEWRLYDLVAGLTTGRPFNIVGVLDRMGSWEAEVWEILTEWGTGGDNNGCPGRSAAVRRAC